MKYLLCFLAVAMLTASGLVAQNLHGLITYERKVFWNKISNELPFISAEKKARNEFQKGWDFSSYTTLRFNPDEDLYIQTNTSPEDPDGKNLFPLYIYYHNRTKETILLQTELAGEKITVSDTAPMHKWKIGNEIKDIHGYVCMKAETQDTLKGQKLTAWFTDAIPVFAGPEGYYGLPGMILELNINDGTAIISASKIVLSLEEKIILPKQKGKAKTLDIPAYNDRLLLYMEDCRKAERNPYWGIRY